MHKVYLELGGNEGNRLQYMELARNAILEKIGQIVQQSSVYETPPWGFTAEQCFYNQVVCVITELGASDLLRVALRIEKKLGRVRGTQQYCSRTMDIDILFYDSSVFNQDGLTIPHPRMHLRKFVLVPMCEIAPNFIHPLINKSIADLLKICSDQSEIKKL